MSLFDTIRYPISCPPSVEELGNLPPDIFRDCMEKFKMSSLFEIIDLEILVSILENFLMDKRKGYNDSAMEMIEYLRQRILDLP